MLIGHELAAILEAVIGPTLSQSGYLCYRHFQEIMLCPPKFLSKNHEVLSNVIVLPTVSLALSLCGHSDSIVVCSFF